MIPWRPKHLLINPMTGLDYSRPIDYAAMLDRAPTASLLIRLAVVDAQISRMMKR